MTRSIDNLTLDVIEKMKLAKIGQYNKWEKMAKKIKNQQDITLAERSYFSTMTRIYKDSKIMPKSGFIHRKLSKEDRKPPCNICKVESTHYCNVNDAYFCKIHLVGHDPNERI